MVDQIREALSIAPPNAAHPPLPSPALRTSYRLRSGDFGSPVLVGPIQGEGAGRTHGVVGRSPIRADSSYSRFVFQVFQVSA
jgi:hypothetical protein